MNKIRNLSKPCKLIINGKEEDEGLVIISDSQYDVYNFSLEMLDCVKRNITEDQWRNSVIEHSELKKEGKY